MKKLALALTAVAAMTGAASAADLAARPYTKAPAVAPAPVTSWTGCYVGAGGGGAMTTNDNNLVDPVAGPLTPNQNNGASGWFGTVQVGCDYQFNNFVVGAFADYDFMDVHGDRTLAALLVGRQKQDQQWAVGGRVGYLVLPQLLTYFSGGYTQGHWTSTDFSAPLAGVPGVLATSPGFTKGGWFIGTGDEYALTSFLPGLFWKTEYRYSEFDRANVTLVPTGPGFPLAGGLTDTQKIREHSVRTELVYRFNWSGAPVAARY